MKYNRVALAGNLGGDPDLRYTTSGKAVCTVNLAVVEYRRLNKQTNQWEEKTAWIKIELWEKRAESFAKHCTSGDNVFVEGRIGMDEWEDKKTKQRRQKVKVIVDQWQFAQSKNDGDDNGNSRSGSGGKRSSNRSSRRSDPEPRTDEPYEDEVPF